mmetsp:Transcript_9386/g.15317  ORF Transcript_9386/g.15317 Transcript_9386/m.15317 type:complete len:447 (-) Transcript_9386:942-2282(-)
MQGFTSTSEYAVVVPVSAPKTSTSGESSNGEGHVKQSASWFTVGLLQINSVIGVGLLAIGGAFAQLGWVLGLVFSFISVAMCVYLSLLQWQAQNAFPEGDSQRKMAQLIFKSRLFSWFVAFMLYSLLFFLCGGYLLAIEKTLKATFHGYADLCNYTWGFITLAILVPGLFIRNLSGLKHLVRLSCLFICSAVALIVGYTVYQMATGVKPETYGENVAFAELTWESFFGGLASITLAYCGTFVFLEMSSEMSVRSDFPKSFYLSAPLGLLLFLVVSVVSYLYQGSKAGTLLDVISVDTPVYNIANCLLFLYMLVVYYVKGIVVARALHKEIWPESADLKGFLPALQHVFCGTLLLVFSFLTATAVPVFELIVSFLGSMFVPFLGYQLPIIFAYGARRHTGTPISKLEYVLWGGIFLLFVSLEIMGTAMNIKKLASFYASGHAPFQCS